MPSTAVGLNTEIKQGLRLSLAMKRSLQCLVLPQHQLRYAVMEVALENPFLMPVSWEPLSSGHYHSGQESPQQADQEESWWENIAIEAKPSLYGILLAQLRLVSIPEYLEPALMCLLDALDEYGFLTHRLPILSQSYAIPLEDLKEAYSWFDELDPSGIGTESLSAFWVYQLGEYKASQLVYDALKLIEQGMQWILPLQPNKLARLLEGSSERTNAALALIRRLRCHPFEPTPGLPHPLETRPELKWTPNDGAGKVEWLTSSIPWTVESEWMGTSFEQGQHLQSYRKEAERFLDSLKQRQSTILRVAQSIIDHQPYFGEYGLAGLRPLTLQVIAEALSMHVSTISRSIQYKAMMTPYGVILLSDFFPSSLKGAEGSVSSTWVKTLLKEWILAEKTRNPLTDQNLVDLLLAHGIQLSRRTVAKYREVMHIPPAYRRKISS
jgi:RNA polymerase sigma-54 factor